MRIQLRIWVNPTYAEVFVNIRTADGHHKTVNAVVDTGADVSLIPMSIMEELDYRLLSSEPIILEQAGIAKQVFEAYEAVVSVYLEDVQGNRSTEFDLPVWFADGQTTLIGFEGLLDRAVLHMDMPALGGYIELPD
jgi:predicted aspartyl protease